MQTLRKVAFWAGMILLSPLVTFLFLTFYIFGMQLAFLSWFRIENRTTRTLWVTPIGMSKSGKFGKAVLLQFVSKFAALWSLRSRDIQVDPDGSIQVIYDWDTANFSDIVVRGAEGEYRQLVVDPDPPKGVSYPSRHESYVIDDWESLPPAAVSVLDAAREPDREWRNYCLILTGFVVMGLYLWLCGVYQETH